MARSESRSSRGSLRWFIPGGVQRARPKKIEALSREREREGERRERRGRSIRGRDTHTHTHRRPSEEVNVRSEVHCLGGKKAGGRGQEREEVYTWRRERKGERKTASGGGR